MRCRKPKYRRPAARPGSRLRHSSDRVRTELRLVRWRPGRQPSFPAYRRDRTTSELAHEPPPPLDRRGGRYGSKVRAAVVRAGRRRPLGLIRRRLWAHELLRAGVGVAATNVHDGPPGGVRLPVRRGPGDAVVPPLAGADADRGHCPPGTTGLLRAVAGGVAPINRTTPRVGRGRGAPVRGRRRLGACPRESLTTPMTRRLLNILTALSLLLCEAMVGL